MRENLRCSGLTYAFEQYAFEQYPFDSPEMRMIVMELVGKNNTSSKVRKSLALRSGAAWSLKLERQHTQTMHECWRLLSPSSFPAASRRPF